MLEYDKEKLGQFLKGARQDARLTQGQVSKKLGYSSPQFISNIERGVSVAPLKTLASLIKLYKCEPEQIVSIILKSQRLILSQKIRQGRSS